MSAVGGRTVRIAHAYGNRRAAIETATAADIDFLEADLWERAGELWARHERRLGFLPLLFDRRPPGVNTIGPWTIPVSPVHYVRPDLDPLRLTELLERTRGKRRLLLDVKDNRSGEAARVYAQTLGRTLAEAQAGESVIVCGKTNLLDSLREAGPNLDVRYSIDEQRKWEAFLRRLDADPGIRGVCMDREFLTEPIAQFLTANGLELFCWTVDDPAEARRLVELGVGGIISNSLPLLEQLDS